MSTDPKTVREDDDAFCPHTAYPLQVTLTLVEGDMTVRHTECGRTVLTDWPYLRAHDVPLTLAYATDDQDEDWLELRLPAGLDEWLQEDEQQPADVVTAEQQPAGAVGDRGSVRAASLLAFLDLHRERRGRDVIASLAVGDGRTVELTQVQLRAVLAERTALAARVAELESEREADVRAVMRCQRAKAGPDAVPAMLALDARFTERIAALGATETEES